MSLNKWPLEYKINALKPNTLTSLCMLLSGYLQIESFSDNSGNPM